jgi:hypothetical protein
VNGEARKLRQFESAERAAANAPGIREVIDRLIVNSPDSDDEPDEIC